MALKLRPVCVHCGKRYGHRKIEEKTVYVPTGAPTPELDTNLHVVKVARWPYGTGQDRVRFDLWDGETFSTGYQRPFCSATCAVDFAQRAYAAGVRL